MTALRDLQAAFAAHLAGHDEDGLVEAVVGDSIPAEARLRVHRHHVRHSLASALAATFPTVEALVGADFFRGMAGAFVERHLPAQPVLAEYGQGFPRFVAGWEPARSLPYLADVARLDWALNLAWHATDEGRLAAADLAAEPAERLPLLRLVLSPGTSLLGSPYPVDRIWTASQPGAAAGEVTLDGGIDLLVLRQADDAAFLRLSRGEAAFLAAVEQGATLETAAGQATGTAPDFDLSSVFARLIGLGCFAALQH
jgi:hypothetical protein